MHQRNVKIQRPCPITLDSNRTAGGVHSWYCGHCEKSVHVLSNMTERQARSFLQEHAGEFLCVTYAVSRDGLIRFKPESNSEPQMVPVSALTSRSRRLAAASFGAALAACTPHHHPRIDSTKIEVQAKEPIDHRMPAGEIIPEIRQEPENLQFLDGEISILDGDIEPPKQPDPEMIKKTGEVIADPPSGAENSIPATTRGMMKTLADKSIEAPKKL